MKPQIRLGLSLALGLFLVACTAEKDPQEPNIPPAPERVAFTLNLEAQGALTEMRDFPLDFKVGSKGALKVNVKEGHKYKARCFLRCEERCFYGDVTFTGTKDGKLTVLRGEDSEVKFYEQSTDKSGDSKDKKYGFEAGKKWYLMVVFGGERLSQSGTDKTLIRFQTKPSGGRLRYVEEGQDVNLDDIPYISDWMPLDIWKEGGDGIGIAQAQGPLSFKPIGTLLRIRVKNNLANTPMRVLTLGYKLNNATKSVLFSLHGGKNDDKPTIKKESKAIYLFVGLTIRTIAAGAEDQGYYLLWLYPEKETGATFQATSWSVLDKATLSTKTNAASMPSNSEVKNLKSGVSYWTKATIDRPRMVLELLDEYNFVGAIPQRATNHSNKGRQMHTYAQAVQIASGQTGYHLPSQDEWQMILGLADPALPSPKSLRIDLKGEPLLGSFFKDAGQGGTESYYRPGPLDANNETNILYAVRFRGHDSQHSTSTYLSAWRYEVKQNPYDHEGYVYVIKSRYLGPGAAVDVDEIAKEDWWNRSDPDEVVRYLPFAGGYYAGLKDESIKTSPRIIINEYPDINNPYQVGNWGTYWTSSIAPPPQSGRAAGSMYYTIAGARYYPDYARWFDGPSPKDPMYKDASLAPTLSGNIGRLGENRHASVRLIKNY